MAPKVTIAVNSVNIMGHLQEGEVHIDTQGILGDNPDPPGTIFAYPFKHYAAIERGLGLNDQDDLIAAGFLTPPSFGETLSLAGTMDEADVRIGEIWAWGSARLRISEVGDQVDILSRLEGCTIPMRMHRQCYSGWLFTVEHPGTASVDDDLILVQPCFGSEVLTVAEAFRRELEPLYPTT